MRFSIITPTETSFCRAAFLFLEAVRMWEDDFGQATRWLSGYGVGLASADRLPVVVRIPAGLLGSLKCDPPKGNGRRPKKKVKMISDVFEICQQDTLGQCWFLNVMENSNMLNSPNMMMRRTFIFFACRRCPLNSTEQKQEKTKLCMLHVQVNVADRQLVSFVCVGKGTEVLPWIWVVFCFTPDAFETDPIRRDPRAHALGVPVE